MFLKMIVPVALLLHTVAVLASDPDPVEDFSIPEPAGNSSPYKNSSAATVEDFTFSALTFPANFTQTGIAKIVVDPTVLPGLNTLGISLARVRFNVGGYLVPHVHPRATEVAFVEEGKFYAGFVDTSNKLFAKVIEQGDVIAFPRGLVHFELNVGDAPGTLFTTFDSQNPGFGSIPNAVFGSGIEEELLQKVFGLTSEELSKLRARFSLS